MAHSVNLFLVLPAQVNQCLFLLLTQFIFFFFGFLSVNLKPKKQSPFLNLQE